MGQAKQRGTFEQRRASYFERTKPNSLYGSMTYEGRLYDALCRRYWRHIASAINQRKDWEDVIAIIEDAVIKLALRGSKLFGVSEEEIILVQTASYRDRILEAVAKQC